METKQYIPSGRVFNICQYETNPRTKQKIDFSESNILSALQHKSLCEWAYVLHDKDWYSQTDIDGISQRLHCEYEKMPAEQKILSADEYVDREMYAKVGDIKPRHWHIVCRSIAAIDVATIAKWFGIEMQYVDLPKGKGKFLDCVQYLTHEKYASTEKAAYDDSEVKANFLWREMLTDRTKSQARYHRDMLTDREALRMHVLTDGWTLSQAQNANPIIFADDLDKLKKLRLLYISQQEPPTMRLNIYVDGAGGIGKSALTSVLAQELGALVKNTDLDKADSDDLFFPAGGKNVAVDGYDGQPVIVWDDRRAIDFITEFGGAGNVFNVFDIFPHRATSGSRNVKYGKIRVNNTINIINGTEPYDEFLNGLCGEYTDKNGISHHAETSRREQAFRRMPLIICVHENDLTFLINKGFTLGTREFSQYTAYSRVRGNLARVQEKLDGMALFKIVTDMSQPAVKYVTEKLQSQDKRIKEIDSIPDDIVHYGEELPIEHTTYEIDPDKKTVAANMAAQQKQAQQMADLQECQQLIADKKILTYDLTGKTPHERVEEYHALLQSQKTDIQDSSDDVDDDELPFK